MIDNPAELAVDPFVFGCMVWFFNGTPKGVSTSTQIYSVVEIVSCNGQEPYTWRSRALYLAVKHAEGLPQARSSSHRKAHCNGGVTLW
ncbi:hypothetical protein D3C77_335310 [compost metagenome]